MTREDVARAIHWEVIIWIAGVVNVGAMVPQLYKIIETRNVDGLALPMFVTYLCVQVALSLDGYFKKNKMLMVCLGLSAVVSVTIILSILYLRYFAGV